MRNTIQQLMQVAIDKNASDLHIVAPYFATLRIKNKLLFLRNFGIIQPETSEEMLLSLLSPEQKTYFLENKEIDIGYDFAGTRFRINIYINRKSIGAAFRLIPNRIKNFAELNLPEIFQTFSNYNQGLILFTGPTGEGKSSSLAAIINDINLRHSNILLLSKIQLNTYIQLKNQLFLKEKFIKIHFHLILHLNPFYEKILTLYL